VGVATQSATEQLGSHPPLARHTPDRENEDDSEPDADQAHTATIIHPMPSIMFCAAFVPSSTPISVLLRRAIAPAFAECCGRSRTLGVRSAFVTGLGRRPHSKMPSRSNSGPVRP